MTTDNKRGANKSKSSNAGLSPFRVLGIALIIDQLGKEPRMAFRYPTSLQNSSSNNHNAATSFSTSESAATTHNNKSVSNSDTCPGKSSSEDLFFTLSSRQMAKLFRPKHSLCGQPMTLSVGGTVFCFRAILMGDQQQQLLPQQQHQQSSTETTSATATSTSNSNHEPSGPSSSASITSQFTVNTSTNNTAANATVNNNNNNSDHLVLFSVVVALAPQVDISSIPLSGWFEGGTDDKSTSGSLHQSLHRLCSSMSLCSSEGGGVGSHGVGGNNHGMMEESHRASASFLAVRRVQCSLARLCRVLEREERRCQYISKQAAQFLKIRANLQKKWEEKAGGISSSTSSSKPPPPPGTSPKSAAADARKKHHRRGGSFSLAPSSVASDVVKERNFKNDNSRANNSSSLEQQEKEQEILEHVLAIGPQEDETLNAELHHGNLGRELVQVFHALSRNDHNFPSSQAILSGRDGVVYVNRHIAVAVEPVSLPKTIQDSISNAIIRPYHTLLFPNASPSQLLQALQSSGFTAPLQQLLLMVRPSKPLADIAVDANLPLSVTMELASYLVSHGACVSSNVLNRGSRLACKRVDRIQELALDFSQTFDDWSVSLFLIVSFLTTNGRTLGESMTALTTGEDPLGTALRSAILSSKFQEEDDAEDYIFVEGNDDNVVNTTNTPGSYESPGATDETFKPRQMVHPRAEELEEVLYSMAIWLLSHQILGHVQEYLVLPNSATASTNSGPVSHHALDTEGDTKDGNLADGSNSERTFDDDLLKELSESDCLNGAASIVAISWKLGLDESKMRSWVMRNDKLRIVSRLPAIGDDWGTV